MTNIPATLDTAVYRKLVLQLLNGLVAGGSTGSVINSNVAVAADGTTRSALKLTSAGRLEVDILSATPADLTIIQGQLNTLIGLTTVQQAEVSGIQTQLASGVVTVSGGGGGSTGISTIQGFDGTAYHNVKTDTLGNLNVNVLSGGGSSTVTLSGVSAGVTIPISGSTGRTWNLATSTDSLTAAVSSIPAVSLASGQNVGVSSLPAVTNAGTFAVQNTAAIPAGTNSIGTVGLNAGSNVIGSISNTSFGVSSLPALPAGSNSIGSVVNNGGTVTLAAGSNTIGAISNSSFGVSTLPANLGTTTLAPVYTQVTNFPATTSISGGSLNNVTLTGSSGVTLPVSGNVSLTGGNVSLTGGTVSLSTVAGGLGTSSLTPIYDSIIGGSLTLTSSSNPTLFIPSAFVTGQAKIATTGTAVQLASNTLTQGVLITALSSNSAKITIGNSSSVTNTTDGTGNGAILTAGSTKSIAATNTNLIWINGTAGDIISFIGS